MEKDPFSLFIELINFDQAIIKHSNNINSLKKELSISENEINNLQDNLKNIKDKLFNAQKDVHDVELKMKELDQQEKQKKEKLENVENTKEYSALKKEIDTIKQSQYSLEPKLVENWNKLETIKKDFESKRDEIEKKISELDALKKDKETKIENEKNEIDKLNKDRVAIEKQVPEEWLSKYGVMRLRVTNPVVPVTDSGSCSACFYQATSQDLINLKHKKLLQCKRCYRFLYKD